MSSPYAVQRLRRETLRCEAAESSLGHSPFWESGFQQFLLKAALLFTAINSVDKPSVKSSLDDIYKL